MKKKILAALLAVCMVLGTVAAAAVDTVNISVVPGMRLVINGQAAKPVNAAGEELELFAYKDATYAPIRYIAELCGLTMDWDAEHPNDAILNGSVVSVAGSRDVTADYVVVGAGMGGLSAAIEAARSGKSVILLEKLPRAGGSSALCEGYFWSTESRLNQETGQGLNTADMKAALKTAAGGKAVEGLIDNICDVATDVMDRFLDGGAAFYKDNFAVSGGAIPDIQIFIHEGGGNGFMQKVLAIAEKEDIDIRYQAKGTDLIYEDGQVKGVTVEDKDGTYRIYAGATILATGGFLRNKELMDEYEPGWYIDDPHCAAGSTGDGHLMAMKLGAHMIGSNFGCVWRFGNTNGYHAENSSGLAPILSFFRVNQEGKRVLNEYGAANVNTNNDIIVHQTNRRVYCFMDSTSTYTGLAELSVAAGLAYKADTLEELCEKYGIDADAFMATVKAYNETKASGENDPDFYVPNAYMVSMSEPPFYASYYEPWATNCLLGLECDAFCRLLDADNQPIPNLYGVGELIIGSFVGDGNYPCCGSCLAAGAYGGVVAVRHAEGKLTEPEPTPGQLADRVTVAYSPAILAMAKEIIAAPQQYTDEQLKAIPEILNAKHRYFWGTDLQDYDALRDVYTEEDGGFRVDWGYGETVTPIEQQIQSAMWTTGPQEDMIPMHFGHNQIVYFLDETHARVLTRMNDRHTYTDNGEVYAGWGLYVDDVFKCADGAWRISCIRLSYGVLENQLRAVRNSQG